MVVSSSYDSDRIFFDDLSRLLSFTKMRSITSPISYLDKPDLYYYGIELYWSEPICRNCEESGKYCRLSNNSNREHNNATKYFHLIPTSGKLNTGTDR